MAPSIVQSSTQFILFRKLRLVYLDFCENVLIESSSIPTFTFMTRLESRNKIDSWNKIVLIDMFRKLRLICTIKRDF